MEETQSELLDALAILNGVVADVTAQQAASSFDAATLEVFWREWPQVGAWADTFHLDGGGRYDPATYTWRPMSEGGLEAMRFLTESRNVGIALR
jgi:hypothetical protein